MWNKITPQKVLQSDPSVRRHFSVSNTLRDVTQASKILPHQSHTKVEFLGIGPQTVAYFGYFFLFVTLFQYY